MYGFGNPTDQRPLDTVVFPDNAAAMATPEEKERVRQHKMDSFMEAVCNIAVGFVISYLVWMFVVAPLFGLKTDAAESFWITCVFTVTSLIRQYVLRRMFDGRTIWETIREKITRPRVS